MSIAGPVICFSTIGFRSEPVESVIPKLARLGYDGVEIWSGHLRGAQPEDLAAIRRMAEQHRVRIAVLAPVFRVTRDVPELIEESFSTAGRMVLLARALAGADGLPMVRALVDAGKGSIGSAAAGPDHWGRAVQALRRITALDPELVYALETRRDTLADTPESALRLLRDVAAANLSISYEPNDGDPLPAWRRLRESVRHVHLHCPPAVGRSGYLEDGGHRLAELIAALRADGYAGTLSVEYRGQDVLWERAASARAWLRSHGI
jgi:3-dehydroshikimate dehydratase